MPRKKKEQVVEETQLEFQPYSIQCYFVRRRANGELRLLLGTIHKHSGRWAFQPAEHSIGSPLLLYPDEMKQLAKFAEKLAKASIVS